MTIQQRNRVLFNIFLMAGAFTFSGGLAMMPLIEKELVDCHALIDKKEMYEYTTIAQTLPGVNAFSSACFIGNKIAGKSGAFWAGLGTILPAFFLMLLASILYQFIPTTGPFMLAFAGIRATSATFVFSAAMTIAKYHLTSIGNIVISMSCFIAIFIFNIQAPLILLLTCVLGVVTYKIGGRL